MTTPDPRTPGSSGDPLSTGPYGTPPPPEPSTPPSTGPAAGTAPARERRAGRTIGRSLALSLLLFVMVVLVLFVVFNTQTVDVSLVFGNVDAPLVVALLVAAVLGGLLVWLAGLVLRARRRNR